MIIVESPTKAKTLSNFLGKGHKVVATMGHIRDLPERKLGVKIDQRPVAGDQPPIYEFKPEYVLMPKKKEAIAKLKAAAKDAKEIFLATDPDREGEAIAWHVATILKGKKSVTSRITFHEITKSAIDKALSSPGKINLQLVDAQQARRVLDRLVGYKLSPLLWQKIRRGLSAGRVQSVAVRLIVDREREIEKFVPEEYWEIFVELRRHVGGLKEGVPTFLVKLVKINGNKAEVKNQTQSQEIVTELEKSNYEVLGVERKEVFSRPAPPFTTSTLQQKAALTLHFSSKRTMKIAQSLYEKGLITYHRTDSFNLSQEALEGIRDYIKSTFGDKYLPEKPHFYKTKSKVAQEAHEAIRPTDIGRSQISEAEDRDEQRLYDLIWKRAITCQMAAAVWDSTKVNVQAAGSTNIYILTAEGKIIKFDGWLKVYGAGKEETDNQLPELNKSEDLDLIKVSPEQKFTQPPPRFNEASLIKVMEELGIGRPSTYAPIISTIQIRQYVEKAEGKFSPTSLGITVNDFLMEYFPNVFDYQFTAKMEDELDDIANGKREWMPVISDFWAPFEQKLTGVVKVAQRVKVPTEVTDQDCPKCKQGKLVIRVGRFGKFLSCSRFPDCDYTAPFINKLENVKCPECGGDIVVRKTRKGKQFYGCANWPKCKYASWRKPK